MANIIKDGQIVADLWPTEVSEMTEMSEAAEAPASAAGQPLLLPLPRWLALRASLVGAQPPLGVSLAPDDDPALLADDLPRLALISVHFPLFTDGRGYSIGRLLRQRYGYRGELRACGDVLRDQIYFLQQCGFNAFALRADQDPDAALAALRDYSWSPLAGQR